MDSKKASLDIKAFLDKALNEAADLDKWSSEAEIEDMKVNVEGLASNTADSKLIEDYREMKKILGSIYNYAKGVRSEISFSGMDSYEIMADLARRYNDLFPESKVLKKRRKTPIRPGEIPTEDILNKYYESNVIKNKYASISTSSYKDDSLPGRPIISAEKSKSVDLDMSDNDNHAESFTASQQQSITQVNILEHK